VSGNEEKSTPVWERSRSDGHGREVQSVALGS
jgi:hypothetical protein